MVRKFNLVLWGQLMFKRRPVFISLPAVMSFGGLCDAFNALEKEASVSGGVVARQAVQSLDHWIRENWGMKKDTPIPFAIQQLYDKATEDLK